MKSQNVVLISVYLFLLCIKRPKWTVKWTNPDRKKKLATVDIPRKEACHYFFFFNQHQQTTSKILTLPCNFSTFPWMLFNSLCHHWNQLGYLKFNSLQSVFLQEWFPVHTMPYCPTVTCSMVSLCNSPYQNRQGLPSKPGQYLERYLTRAKNQGHKQPGINLIQYLAFHAFQATSLSHLSQATAGSSVAHDLMPKPFPTKRKVHCV